MIQALNYCTHVIEELTSSGGSEKVIHAIRKAEKFALPIDAELIDISSLKREFWDLLKLPYPIIAIEFPTSEHGKKVVLAEERGSKIFWASFMSLSSLRLGRWADAPYISSVDVSKLEHCGKALVPDFDVYPCESTWLKASIELCDKMACVDLLQLLQFCCAINCENVSTESVPAPDKLNNKRIASRKEPFYSFRVLTIPAHSNSGAAFGGTHAGPRLHLRRGHLRRLPSTKVVWVRHCIVGNPDKTAASGKAYAL